MTAAPPGRQPTWLAWTRRILVTGGALIAVYGIVNALTDSRIAHWPYLRYGMVVLFGHDLIIMPLVIAVGVLVLRFLPAWARPVVQGALLVTATLTVVALPLVLGYGRRGDDPSALPHDYSRGLLITLAVVWTVAGLLLVLKAVRRHRPAATDDTSATPPRPR